MLLSIRLLLISTRPSDKSPRRVSLLFRVYWTAFPRFDPASTFSNSTHAKYSSRIFRACSFLDITYYLFHDSLDLKMRPGIKHLHYSAAPILKNKSPQVSPGKFCFTHLPSPSGIDCEISIYNVFLVYHKIPIPIISRPPSIKSPITPACCRQSPYRSSSHYIYS